MLSVSYRGHKRASDLLELELEVVVSHNDLNGSDEHIDKKPMRSMFHQYLMHYNVKIFIVGI